MERGRSIPERTRGRLVLPPPQRRTRVESPARLPELAGPVDPDRRRVHGLFAAGALLGAALVATALAPHGLGVLQFGFHQFAAAECLRHGEPWILTRGGPYTIWPPLYPVLLAGLRSLGLSYPGAALAIQLAAHASVVYLGASLVLRLFGSVRAALATLVLLLLSPWLHEGALAVRNEPLMAALLLASVHALAGYFERPGARRLAAAAGLAALACLQHYKGIALVGPAALLVATGPRALAWRTRLARAAGYATIAILPLSLWMLRNLRLEGGWSGYRYPVDLPFSSQLELALGTFRDWVWFDPDARGSAKLACLVVALGFALFALAPIFRRGAHRDRRALLLYLAFPVTYVALLLRWAATTSLDAIDTRLLLLVQPFFWGLVALGADRVLRSSARAGANARLALALVVAGFFGLHLVSDATRLARQIARVRAEGAGGFVGPHWRDSGLLAWLRAHRRELEPSEVYSNLPELVLYATDRRATFVDATAPEPALGGADEGDWVVWCEELPHASPAPGFADEERALALVARFDKGSVWRVGRAP